MVINTVVAIGALFYAVYVLLGVAVGTTTGNTNPIIRQIAPAVLMALWHGWMLFAFTKSRLATRRAFPISYGAVAVLVTLMLFAFTIGGIRSQALDQQRESDVASIHAEINRFYRDEKRLPLSLDDIAADNLNNKVNDYDYRKGDDKRYQLCTEFIDDTTGMNRDYDPYDYTYDNYANYPIWSSHKSGEYCYKIIAMPTYDERTSVVKDAELAE